MTKFLTAALCGTTAMVAAASADAARFDYRFAFTAYGSASVVATGTLDATDLGNGSYSVTGATGNFLEEYVRDDKSVTIYDTAKINGVGPTWYPDVAGPGFTFTGGSLTSFVGAFFGKNDAGTELSYDVTYSGGQGMVAFGEIGGDLTEAVLTPSMAGGVPEPATWALMILGMGAVGAAMRRRPSVKATVRFA